MQGQEYAEAYILEYQRVEGGVWIRFRDRKASEVRFSVMLIMSA